MFEENKFLNYLLGLGRCIIPKPLFKLAQPIYHWGLSIIGALIYGFPSRNLKVIAITGTKGKSTTVFMISKILEDQGLAVAAIGSLGFKIKEKTWPNNLKMTLPGRLKLQKFLRQALNAGVKYVVLEATSEGIAQSRLAGINVDCAVFTNLHREHLESHGSFENYMKAKQRLFLKVRNIHVLNIDDLHFEKFANFPARQKITYGMKWGMITKMAHNSPAANLDLKLLGDFNEYNALAALTVAFAYRLDMDHGVTTLNSIESVPGRMEILNSSKGFKAVIDYAHTPDSLKLVYENLKREVQGKLICVLGAAGGGRDKWKRSEFGKIAGQFCDQIILTDEDPYDEDPQKIIDQVASGINQDKTYLKILDRREAIGHALASASAGDIVIITGKGSETSMAVAGGKKIPWSDKEIVTELI
jgi:UDP-N-acetylmuramoyl-L-alanyl-D-glutamate--2,6-diaminopimelate ligase